MKTIEHIVETSIENIRFNSFVCRLQEAITFRQIESDRIRSYKADESMRNIKRNYENIKKETENTLQKRNQIKEEIKSLRRDGIAKISEYSKAKQVIADYDYMIRNTEEASDCQEIEDKKDTYIFEKEEISNKIVNITTRLKHLNNRSGYLSSAYESLKQKMFSVSDDFEGAQLCHAELKDEIARYKQNIRSGAIPSIKKKNLLRNLRKMERLSSMNYLKDVRIEDRMKENSAESFELEGKKTQFINDDYVNKCIDYITQSDQEVRL